MIVGVVIPLSFGPVELWVSHLGRADVFQLGAEGLGPEAQSPGGLPRDVLVSKSVPSVGCWQLSSNSGFFETSCQDGVIATQRQVGCVVLQNLFLG